MSSINRATAGLAAVGSTGNNTHSSYSLSGTQKRIGIAFRITAVGGTPTVTYALQGTYDDAVDGSCNWFTLSFRKTDGTSATTLVASDTQTATGTYAAVVPMDVPVRKIRLVTTLNTNVTYAADIAESTG